MCGEYAVVCLIFHTGSYTLDFVCFGSVSRVCGLFETDPLSGLSAHLDLGIFQSNYDCRLVLSCTTHAKNATQYQVLNATLKMNFISYGLYLAQALKF